jgi:hypothetical protein
MKQIVGLLVLTLFASGFKGEKPQGKPSILARQELDSWYSDYRRREADWQLIGTSDERVYHFHRRRLVVRAGHVRRAWLRAAGKGSSLVVFLNTRQSEKKSVREGLDEYLRTGKLQVERPKRTGGPGFFYQLSLVEYRCGSDEMRTLEIIDYDHVGQVNFSKTVSERDATWSYIAPNSIGESMLTSICTYKPTNFKKNQKSFPTRSNHQDRGGPTLRQ